MTCFFYYNYPMSKLHRVVIIYLSCRCLLLVCLSHKLVLFQTKPLDLQLYLSGLFWSFTTFLSWFHTHSTQGTLVVLSYINSSVKPRTKYYQPFNHVYYHESTCLSQQ
ncbi:unnamed protein product [Spodoptera littoralis]|uniref:Uncharacterized protein n=1 Tax=Spodoptera littoralis TaxID=7109 RepID=A0A9P0IDH2_SPOLI|nr:unnamed protein product [Spodoptera littoralis]CAH1644832.1 unnamed protein product [Spodoptera littoralis]